MISARTSRRRARSRPACRPSGSTGSAGSASGHEPEATPSPPRSVGRSTGGRVGATGGGCHVVPRGLLVRLPVGRGWRRRCGGAVGPRAVGRARGGRPAGAGAGFAGSYPDDLAGSPSTGSAHLRYTLEWARLEPENGRHDDEAIEHTRSSLGAARDAGVSVWACLHDGASPGWFADDEHGLRRRARPSLLLGPPRRVRGRGVRRPRPRLGPGLRADPLGLAGGSTDPARPACVTTPRRSPARAEAHPPGLGRGRAAPAGVGRPVASAQWVVPVLPRPRQPRFPGHRRGPGHDHRSTRRCGAAGGGCSRRRRWWCPAGLPSPCPGRAGPST